MNEIENGFHIIDPTQDWKTVVDEMTSCKAILSSSLHGLVVSDAYSIPNAFPHNQRIIFKHLLFLIWKGVK